MPSHIPGIDTDVPYSAEEHLAFLHSTPESPQIFSSPQYRQHHASIPPQLHLAGTPHSPPYSLPPFSLNAGVSVLPHHQWNASILNHASGHNLAHAHPAPSIIPYQRPCRELLNARVQGKQEALEFMIQRLECNDEFWKVVDLEEYTLESPDIVISDRHIHSLAKALSQNTQVVAIRLPECEGMVTWNSLWPLFESIKNNKTVTRMFVSSSGKVFGHVVSVFLTNSILGFFSSNYTIRTLGSFSKSPALKKNIRVALNRNILNHYVPKKILMLRKLWNSIFNSSHPLKTSGNDALSMVFEFDEHLLMIRSMAKSRSESCPLALGAESYPRRIQTTLADSEENCDSHLEDDSLYGCISHFVGVCHSNSHMRDYNPRTTKRPRILEHQQDDLDL